LNSRQSIFTTFVIGIATLLLQGCSAMSHFEGASPGSTLALRGIPKVELPSDLRLNSKATGQYEFKAGSATGQTLYGLLPLRVNGGSMAGSIIFFAPALFIGGFRDAFGFYQIDPDAGVLRFKMTEADPWRSHQPTAAETIRAKAYFDILDAKQGSTVK
jgi:hypothetical protein